MDSADHKPLRYVAPRQVALFTALSIAVVVGLVLALVNLVSGAPAPYWWVAAISTAAFAFAYFAVGKGIERFINNRIKLIYRTVHELRSKLPAAGAAQEPAAPEGDLLLKVNADVEAWAREKRQEITSLREREKFRREFIGNLAHELKTPIFNIQGYILTLLEGGLEDEKVNRDFLNRASNGVDRMIKIVEDLDMITKLESGVIDLKLGRTDLHQVVADIVRSFEMHANEKGIRIINRVPQGTQVSADRDRLAQVFVNLFSNALAYGKPGGTCEVKVLEMDDQVVVEVADDGIGVSQEHLPRLFERFYRVGKSRARNEGGSGLGLAIVKHIIDAHGQTISVSSREGEGTTFSFTLRKLR